MGIIINPNHTAKGNLKRRGGRKDPIPYVPFVVAGGDCADTIPVVANAPVYVDAARGPIYTAETDYVTVLDIQEPIHLYDPIWTLHSGNGGGGTGVKRVRLIVNGVVFLERDMVYGGAGFSWNGYPLLPPRIDASGAFDYASASDGLEANEILHSAYNLTLPNLRVDERITTVATPAGSSSRTVTSYYPVDSAPAFTGMQKFDNSRSPTTPESDYVTHIDHSGAGYVLTGPVCSYNLTNVNQMFSFRMIIDDLEVDLCAVGGETGVRHFMLGSRVSKWLAVSPTTASNLFNPPNTEGAAVKRAAPSIAFTFQHRFVVQSKFVSGATGSPTLRAAAWILNT